MLGVTQKVASHDVFDVITLILGILGSILGAVAIAWQFATWKLSGSRVKVSLHLGGLGPRGAVLAPADGRRGVDLPEYASTPVVAIKARNVGRMAVNVERVTATLSNGFSVQETLAANPKLPHRLEPGASETWYLSVHMISATIYATKLPHAPVYMSIELGDGKTLLTKETVTIPAAQP